MMTPMYHPIIIPSGGGNLTPEQETTLLGVCLGIWIVLNAIWALGWIQTIICTIRKRTEERNKQSARLVQGKRIYPVTVDGFYWDCLRRRDHNIGSLMDMIMVVIWAIMILIFAGWLVWYYLIA